MTTCLNVCYFNLSSENLLNINLISLQDKILCVIMGNIVHVQSISITIKPQLFGKVFALPVRIYIIIIQTLYQNISISMQLKNIIVCSIFIKFDSIYTAYNFEYIQSFYMWISFLICVILHIQIKIKILTFQYKMVQSLRLFIFLTYTIWENCRMSFKINAQWNFTVKQ